MGSLPKDNNSIIFEYMPNNKPYEDTYCWVDDNTIQLKTEQNSTVQL